MEDKSLRTALLEKSRGSSQSTENSVLRNPVQPKQENLKINLTRLKQENQKVRQEEQKKTKSSSKLVEKNQINFFGGEYKIQPKEEISQDIKAQELTSVIETPNYDLMETLSEAQEEKVFKVEKNQPKAERRISPLMKKIKIGIMVLLIGVFGSWTIYNAVELSQVVTEYNLKLDQYLLKLGTLDSASGMNDLFPTYPEDFNKASSIEKKSNWFDRLCDFIAGIFGG